MEDFEALIYQKLKNTRNNYYVILEIMVFLSQQPFIILNVEA